MTQLKVNGGFVDLTIGMVGDLAWSQRWGGGCWEAKWQMNLPENYHHTDFHIDAPVQIMDGPEPVWGGLMGRPVFDGEVWQFTADGYGKLADRFLALTAAGNTTSKPSTAVTQAIAEGLPWLVDSTVPGGALSTTNVAATDVTDGLNYIHTLLDAWCADDGIRWAVGPTGLFYTAPDPTTPTLHLKPGTAVLGISDDESFASHLFGRYRNTSTTFATVNVQSTLDVPYRQEGVDLTDLGVISSAKATQRLNGMLAQGKARPAWANGFELDAYELVTAGGVACDFASLGLRPELVRMHGAFDPVDNVQTSLDFVIGEVWCTADASTVKVTPLGIAEGLTLRSAFEAARAPAKMKG